MKYAPRTKTLAAVFSGLAFANMMLAGGAAAAATVGGLELLDAMGDYRQDLYVFYAATPSETEIRETLALSEGLGKEAGVVFDKETLQDSKTRIGLGSSADASATFEVDTVTGNFLFNGGMNRYRTEKTTAGLPSAEEAAMLAEKVLAKLDLAADRGEMILAHVGGLNMAVTEGKGDSTIFEKLRTVRYSRIIGGLPVEGDARIIVHFGENAATAGMVYQWPKLAEKRQLGEGGLQNPAALRKAALDQIYPVVGKALEAKLTKADLVLYDDGKGIMEPAYHLVVERYFDYGEREPVMIPYDFYVPVPVKPVAFYPHVDVADVQPADGTATGKIDNAVDQ